MEVQDNIGFLEEETEPIGADAERAFANLAGKLERFSRKCACNDLLTAYDNDMLHLFLEESFRDCVFSNVRVGVWPIQLPVRLPLPCHGIGLSEALVNILNGKIEIGPFFCDPVIVGMPIVTYMGAFIISGHHRWLQTYLLNPRAHISAINISYIDGSPWRALGDFRRAISRAKSSAGFTSLDDDDIYKIDKGAIREHIECTMSDSFVMRLCDHVDKVKCRDDAVKHLLNAAVELRINNFPIAKPGV